MRGYLQNVDVVIIMVILIMNSLSPVNERYGFERVKK
jgi:hypothetical protein